MSDYKTIDELMAGKAVWSWWTQGIPDLYRSLRTLMVKSWQVYTPPPKPTERPQLWWVKSGGCTWYLTSVARTSEDVRDHYGDGGTYRPSGIYAPED